MVWPVNFYTFTNVFTLKKHVRSKFSWIKESNYTLRSDELASWFLGLVLPGVLIGLGSLEGQDSFAYLKSFSLMFMSLAFIFFKYHAGYPHPSRFWSTACTVVVHGGLAINVLEACFFELAKFEDSKWFNYVNGVSGIASTIGLIVISHKYGCGVLKFDQHEKEELSEVQKNRMKDRIMRGDEVQMRCNLTPLYIVGYTFWNMGYMASYFPLQAALYIACSLEAPFLSAFVGHSDWLEFRVHSLLAVSNFSTFLWGANGGWIASHGFMGEIIAGDAFRIAVTIIGTLFNVAFLYEALFLVSKNKPHLGKGWWVCSHIDVADCHPKNEEVLAFEQDEDV